MALYHNPKEDKVVDRCSTVRGRRARWTRYRWDAEEQRWWKQYSWLAPPPHQRDLFEEVEGLD